MRDRAKSPSTLALSLGILRGAWHPVVQSSACTHSLEVQEQSGTNLTQDSNESIVGARTEFRMLCYLIRSHYNLPRFAALAL